MENIKQRITDYWDARAEGFEEQRQREFFSDKKERWKNELHRFLPGQEPLRILDIGTGTGFFACLFAEEGHEVIGIDLCPNMIQHAEHMSRTLGIPASFSVMDAEETSFEAEYFDVLVTRNLTWTLPHLKEAYLEWYRILKPDGVLINFDADYYRERNREEQVPLPKQHAHMFLSETMKEENERITDEIGQLQRPRPEWDIQLLREAGFQNITVDPDVYRRIYREVDEFYNPARLFVISARKR